MQRQRRLMVDESACTITTVPFGTGSHSHTEAYCLPEHHDSGGEGSTRYTDTRELWSGYNQMTELFKRTRSAFWFRGTERVPRAGFEPATY